MANKRELRPLRYSVLLLVAVVIAAVSYPLCLMLLHSGRNPYEAGLVKFLVLSAVATGLLVWGRGVKAMRQGKPTTMTPLRAVKVAAMAQACALFGAVASGFFISELILLVQISHTSILLATGIYTGLSLVGAIYLLIAGKVVESWCIVDAGDDDKKKKHSARGTVAPKQAHDGGDVAPA